MELDDDVMIISSSSSSAEEDSDYEYEKSDGSEENGSLSRNDGDDDDRDTCRGDDDDNFDGDVDSLADKVDLLLREGRSLSGLKLTECKTYLRKNGLRLMGTKAVCIDRILEHWRIKDGTGEAVYPTSSFVINCKGDVCRGDVVLFRQKVYLKSEKMKRHGKLAGTRTVVGKVVKESYGSAKQQHTFTIEVLWSKGTQKLPPLHPLLVKGRNLYRLQTLRQPWGDEAERLRILSEKHDRGAAARHARDTRKERKMQSTNLGRGRKDEKHQKHKEPNPRRKQPEVDKGKHALRKTSAFPQVDIQRRRENPAQTTVAPACSYAPRAYNPRLHAPTSQDFPVQNQYGYQKQFPSFPFPAQNHYVHRYNQRYPPPHYYRGATSEANGSRSFEPYADTSLITSHHGRPHGTNFPHYADADFNSSRAYEMRDLDRFSDLVISHRPEGLPYGERKYRSRADSRR